MLFVVGIVGNTAIDRVGRIQYFFLSQQVDRTVNTWL
jgi:hypothetical protein